MLRMRDYTPELRDRIAAVAARAGVHLRRRPAARARHGRPDRAQGRLPGAAIGSVTKYKLPLNYHSQRDTAERVYETVRDAAVVCEVLVRESAATVGPLAAAAGARARGRRLRRGCDLARESVLLELAQELAEPGPGATPSSAASSSPGTSGGSGPASRSANAWPSTSRASSRCAAIAGSALRPRVASRSATVSSVTSAEYGAVAAR